MQVMVTPADAPADDSADALADRLGYALDLDNEGKDVPVKHLYIGCFPLPRSWSLLHSTCMRITECV